MLAQSVGVAGHTVTAHMVYWEGSELSEELMLGNQWEKSMCCWDATWDRTAPPVVSGGSLLLLSMAG